MRRLEFLVHLKAIEIADAMLEERRGGAVHWHRHRRGSRTGTPPPGRAADVSAARALADASRATAPGADPRAAAANPTDNEAKLRYLQAVLPPSLAGEPAERLETHMSWLVRGADRVLKMKKPGALSFLDFNTLEAREHDAREEVREMAGDGTTTAPCSPIRRSRRR
jgi:hypothetical protein